MSRALAQMTIGDIVDDSIDYLSQNPALAQLVRDQIGAQSIGLAGTVARNGRAIGVVGDWSLRTLLVACSGAHRAASFRRHLWLAKNRRCTHRKKR